MKMSARRGKCVFNTDLAKKYPFIKRNKTDSDVRCDLCRAEFNIANAGKTDIDKHIGTKKHAKALKSASSSQSLTNFLKPVNFSMAACEEVWAYHSIKANNSFRSSDCSSKLFRTCFDMKNFHCARTKSEAIVTNVFAPFAQEELKKELSGVRYVSISTDASNHGNAKMMPVMARYFIPIIGVRVKMLEFTSLKGETSEMIASLILKTTEENQIEGKTVGFCGDDCPTNFGSCERGGENHVFYRLRKENPKMIGVGCGAHIEHNSFKYACDFLPIDIENIVVKIFSYFYINTVRVEALKEICNTIQTNYSQLLGYANTRFLALGSAIGSILKLFEPLKIYFLSLDRPPTMIKTFFESRISKLWLLFVKEQTEYFQETVLKIEGDNISAFEVWHYLNVLKVNIMNRKVENYLDPETEEERNVLVRNEGYDAKMIDKVFHQFYDDALDYLSKWTVEYEVFEKFTWVDLRHFPDWVRVKKSFEILSEKTNFDMIKYSSKVFEQFGYIKNYCTEEKIAQWKVNKIHTQDHWIEVFKHMDVNQVPFIEFSSVIEFVLCFFGTSAPVERVFAHVTKIWKTECSQLSINTLKLILSVKLNMEHQCNEFFKLLKTRPELIRKIGAQEKYEFKQPKTNDSQSPSAMSVEIDSDDD